MPVAVSMGDPAGIGLDIALMSWRQRSQHGLPPFVLYADLDVVDARARALGLAVPIAAITHLAEATAAFADALPIWRVPIGARAVPMRPSSRRSRWRPRPWPRAMRWRW